MPYKLKKKFRLEGYDYSQDGEYFVTVCTKGFRPYFGKVVDGKMEVTALGSIAVRFLREIPNHFSFVSIESYVVMPNHVHAIISIVDVSCRNGPWTVRTGLRPDKNSLSIVIRNYKAAVTRWSRLNGIAQFHWQPRFHDHIIRNEKSYARITQYIENNPLKWESDAYFGKGQW